MASMYSARPSYSGGGDSLLDSIMRLVNPTKGGPSFGPDGSVTFAPYSGFNASVLNAQAALPIYLSQQNFKNETSLLDKKHGYNLDEEKVRNANAQALQQLVNSGAIDLEKLRGSNAINTAKIAGEIQTGLENTRHKNTLEMEGTKQKNAVEMEGIKSGHEINKERVRGEELRKGFVESGKQDRESATLKQQSSVLGERGIPFSNENLAVYNQSQVDPLMRMMLNDNMLRIKAQEDPSTQSAATTGFQQNLLAPAFKNVREATTMLPPNTSALIPNIGGTTNYLNASGPFATETTQLMGETKVPQGMPGAGMVLNPGKPVTTTMYSGGGIKVPLSELIKQAQQVVPSAQQQQPAETQPVPNLFGTPTNLDSVSQMMKLLGY